MRFYLRCAAGAALLLGPAAPVVAAEPIAGRWITESRDAQVRIAPCGKALCGRIVKFLTPPQGGPDPRDLNNADPAKRSRRILGLAILSGFTLQDGEWKGQIYDPRSGKTYSSVLTRKGARLDVKGCVSVFCQTQVWTSAN